MQRDISKLDGTTFDLLVVGGGALGACAARDAALRGLTTALVEQEDFAARASGNSLKILHGGFRYLQRLSFRRMRRSIQERTAWFRIAPHLVEPLAMVVPSFRHGLERTLPLMAASRLNDMVSWDRNAGVSPERALPTGHRLTRADVVDRVPYLAHHGELTGGIVFYDGLMYSAERLILETVRGASEAGAVVVNHARVEGPARARQDAVVVPVRDMVTGDEVHVRARHVVSAAGGSADQVSRQLTGEARDMRAAYTLALNVVVNAVGTDVAFPFQGRERRLFVVPWRGETMIGTGYYPVVNGPPRSADIERSVEEFLEEVHSGLPQLAVNRADVRLVHHGALPLDPRRPPSTLTLLDRPRIVDHAADGHPYLITAWTEKLTTARHLAEKLVDLVFRKRGTAPPPCRTAYVPLPGAPTEPTAELVRHARRELGDGVPPDIVEHLVRSYGSRYQSVVSASNKRDLSERIHPDAPVTSAQVRFALDAEMALSVEDVLMRRTELGARGLSNAAVRATVGELIERQTRQPR